MPMFYMEVSSAYSSGKTLLYAEETSCANAHTLEHQPIFYLHQNVVGVKR